MLIQLSLERNNWNGMSYCLNPQCFYPHNSGTASYCQRCGLSLKLHNRYRPQQLIGQGGFGKTYLAVDEHLPSTPKCVIKQFFLPNSTPQQFRKATQLFYQEAIRLDQLGKHPQIPLPACSRWRLRVVPLSFFCC